MPAKTGFGVRMGQPAAEEQGIMNALFRFCESALKHGETGIPKTGMPAHGRRKVAPREICDLRTMEFRRLEVALPGATELPDGRVLTATVRALEGKERPPREDDPHSGAEWVDYDALGRPACLVVRSRRAGDEFRPLGAGGGRSVKRFLIDMKIPKAERARVPVVATPEGVIIWLAPLRLDERARVTASTREVLVLALRPPPDDKHR